MPIDEKGHDKIINCQQQGVKNIRFWYKFLLHIFTRVISKLLCNFSLKSFDMLSTFFACILQQN